MPNSDGQLTHEEKRKFVSWIETKGKDHTCPVCKMNSWSVGDHVLNGSIFSGGGLIVGGTNYPTVFLVCNNCSYVRHFMAVPIGIIGANGGEQNV